MKAEVMPLKSKTRSPKTHEFRVILGVYGETEKNIETTIVRLCRF